MKTKERHTNKTSINNLPFSFLFPTTGGNIGDTGATSLSESLKSNATLTELNLCCEDKRKTQKRYPSTIHSFPFLFPTTGNKIGDTGAASLNESLKSNTTLTKIDLSREDKRKKTHKCIHQQITLFHAQRREWHW